VASAVIGAEISNIQAPGILGGLQIFPNIWKLTLLLYGLALILPLISYPRVPSFRVLFLMGSMAGAGSLEALWRNGRLTFLARLVSGSDGELRTQGPFTQGLFTLMILSIITALVIPNVMRQGFHLKLIPGIVVGQFAVLLILSRWILPWVTKGTWLASPQGRIFAVLGSLSALVWVLSLVFSKRNFGFGGLASGLSLTALSGGFAQNQDLSSLLSLFLPAYLLFGGLYIWVIRLRFRVSYDPLMQIYNRATCDQILSEGSAGRLGRRPFSIGMVDVDHFKGLNDRFGHTMGDQVLHQVAQSIRNETLPPGVCCRYGGEEIIVFLRNMEPDESAKVFENIRKAVQKIRMKSGRRTVKVTVSIGWVPVKSSRARTLLGYVERADKAMYKAKANGRNRVVRG